MKKVLKFLMAFVLTFVFTMGISHADEDTFKVGMEVNYAPFNFSQVNDANGAVEIKNSKGEFANGYDVQIAKKIADELGKKLEIYTQKFWILKNLKNYFLFSNKNINL